MTRATINTQALKDSRTNFKDKNIMIDIETLGVRHDAAFISLGACYFDPINNIIDDQNTFYRRIDWDSALQNGTITASTIKWWMQQSEKERFEITKDGIAVARALHDFDVWISNITCFRSNEAKVWSKGSDFDIVILRNAYNNIEKTIPWRYNNARDVRTIFDIFDKEDYTEEELNILKSKGNRNHNALSDALVQAEKVCMIYQKLLNLKQD